MVDAWRIVRRVHSQNAFTGLGSYEFGGRWNHQGHSAVYLADSPSLAILEVLVHNNSDREHVENAFVQFHVEIPDNMLENVGPTDKLPDDWNISPPSNSTMDMGTAWLKSLSSVGLLVPSTVVQIQNNIIINPRHPNFDRITIHPQEDIRIDPRLVR